MKKAFDTDSYAYELAELSGGIAVTRLDMVEETKMQAAAVETAEYLSNGNKNDETEESEEAFFKQEDDMAESIAEMISELKKDDVYKSLPKGDSFVIEFFNHQDDLIMNNDKIRSIIEKST